MGSGIVELRSVDKSFRKDGDLVDAVHNLNLTVAAGELVAVIGPSGCGKSTILNMIAGLMRTSSGVVAYDGQPVTKTNTRVGYMTQRDTLVPWRTVKENIRMPLEIRGARRSTREQRVREFISLIELQGFERHYPAELSGGMRQRVALARTLIYEPETLLMDEPFGALDALTRVILQQQFLSLWEKRKHTVLFVTHDLNEAILLADRVIVMTGRPGTVRREFEVRLPRPRDPFSVAEQPEFVTLYRELASALGIKKGEVGDG